MKTLSDYELNEILKEDNNKQEMSDHLYMFNKLDDQEIADFLTGNRRIMFIDHYVDTKTYILRLSAIPKLSESSIIKNLLILSIYLDMSECTGLRCDFLKNPYPTLDTFIKGFEKINKDVKTDVESFVSGLKFRSEDIISLLSDIENWSESMLKILDAIKTYNSNRLKELKEIYTGSYFINYYNKLVALVNYSEDRWLQYASHDTCETSILIEHINIVDFLSLNM